MGWLQAIRGKARQAPGVPQARHVAERAVAPYLRADLHSLHLDFIAAADRIDRLERRIEELNGVAEKVADIERHQPAVINAISSTNGSSRFVRREIEELREQIAASNELVASMRGLVDDTRREVWDSQAAANDRDGKVWTRFGELGDELQPHIETIRWLLGRVEMVRAEVMNEVRYGRGQRDLVEPEIIDPSAVRPDGETQVNLGCGHLPLEGYANVDMRPLPGVDIVAASDALPFEPGTVAAIRSAHFLEHFPEEELRRKLLPYWLGLLKPGGAFTAVVPDLEAMTAQLSAGEIDFTQYRLAAYGGQEYEGDFHFTGFTPASLSALFTEAGLVDVVITASARANGDCLECEVTGMKSTE